MRISSFPIALLVALAASACMRENGRADTGSKSNPPQAAPAPAAPAQARPEAAPAGEMSLEQAKAELPGFPVEELAPYLRGELVAAAKDEFVYDGSPYTLAGCLEQDRSCRAHAIRGLNLVANQLSGGASRTEALTNYNRYYASFEKKNRRSIDLAGVPCLGNPDAKVTLVEFSDFECPHCAAARPVLEAEAKQNPDVRLCFKHFPLPGHSNAMSAAQAAVFAQSKGKFWELHDLLFENQQRLSPQKIKELVQQVGLDPNALVQAVQKDELSPVVEKQRDEGRQLGILGTPTIYVNGRQLSLPLSPELLRFTIDDELEWQSHGGKW